MTLAGAMTLDGCAAPWRQWCDGLGGRLRSPLGEGGMDELWKAQDTRFDRTIALKVIFRS
jgi:hypothetical protein